MFIGIPEARLHGIKIWTSQKLLTVEVSDEGKGMPVENRTSMFRSNHGVGLSGMRESVRELGGKLEIHSSEKARRSSQRFRWLAQFRSAHEKYLMIERILR